ncbi:MAG: class I SAM-dependent methyltransferase [Gemmatimonadota bacterium]|jgi:SAM-dependent methyltransferase
MTRLDDHWEDPDVVRRFGEREPDHRLRAMVEELDDPGSLRALDVGCAGGRNTVFLARHGADVHALDASEGMVDETRRRLAPVVGRQEAERRVRLATMDDLSAWETGTFDLVVGLGIYQNARDLEEWDRAVGETARVLRPGGRCLVAHFTPEVDLTGEGVTAVDDRPHVFRGMPGGRTAVLFHADELDRAFGSHGLVPEVESETVVVEKERGRRATVNALYVRTPIP